MSRFLPPWALALSLNGFFLYLGVLDLAGRAPRTAVTGVWYALVGLLCLAGAWIGREMLFERLRRPPRPTLLHVVAGALVAGWFLLNVALLTDGSLPKKLAALLVLWTLPTAVLALSLTRDAVRRTAIGLASLGCVFVAIEIVAIFAGRISTSRFSPIANLDPISAAQHPALGAVGLLVLRPQTQRGELLRAAGVLLLAAGAVLPASRGAILELVAALGVVAFLGPRSVWRLAVPAAVVGLAVGFAGAKVVGSSGYLASTLPGGSSTTTGEPRRSGEVGTTPAKISTLSIRLRFWKTALRELDDKPIEGHGVAMFVDRTPEAYRLKIAGSRTYPHNSAIESAWSLGLLGAAAYALWLCAALVALVLLVRRSRASTTVFVAALWAFALVSASVSGEIGADAPLWAACSLAAGLYADRAFAR